MKRIILAIVLASIVAIAQEVPVNSPLYMDRSDPLGNSAGVDGRRALHVMVENTNPIPVLASLSIASLSVSSLVSQGTVPWVVDGSSYPITVLQGTSPWVTSGGGGGGGTVDQGSGGNSPWLVNIGSLSSLASIVTYQGTSPWVTSRNWILSSGTDSINVGNFPATQPVSGTVAVSNFPATQGVTQSTSPWLTSRNWTLSSLTDSIVASLSGTGTVNQGTSPWVTSVNNFPSTQSVTQGTSPWVVGQSSGSNFHVNVDSAPTTSVTQGTSPWLTSRNWSLSSLTDSVVASISGTATVNQGTNPWVTSRSWSLSSLTDSVTASLSGTSSVIGTMTDTTQSSSVTVSPATIDFACSNLNALRFQVITSANPLSCNSFGKTLSSDTAQTIFIWDETNLFSNNSLIENGFYDVSCAGYSTFELQCTGASVSHPNVVEFRANPSASGNSNLMGGFLNTVGAIDSIPLPPGASTSANQTSQIASFTTMISSLSTLVSADTTLSVNAATATNQTTQISSVGTTNSLLTTLDTDLKKPQVARFGSDPGTYVMVGGVYTPGGQSLGNAAIGSLQMDNNLNLLTRVNTSLPAGTNSIGTVVLGTGLASIGAVALVPNSTITATQATGTNLHVVVDTAPSIVVTQNIGSNLHVNVDSAPSTVVSGTVSATQGTTPYLVKDSADYIDGNLVSNNTLKVGGVFNTSPATITNGAIGSLQLDTNQNLLTRINTSLPAGSNSIGTVVLGTGLASVGTVGQEGTWSVRMQDGSGTNLTTTSNNLDINLKTIGGSVPVTGTGASGSGIPRVTVSNDSSLAANQSVNTNQFGGSSVVTGTGTSGAGIPRFTIASDSQLSLGTNTGKTNVQKTGSLTTTAVTADQVVLTYTVTTGKTLYLQYLRMDSRLTALSVTGAILGTISAENPSGTKIITNTMTNPTTETVDRVDYTFSEPIPIASATVIRCVTTPAATTSTLWECNFGGYEK